MYTYNTEKKLAYIILFYIDQQNNKLYVTEFNVIVGWYSYKLLFQAKKK